MLVLSRRADEAIVIGGNIIVTVIKVEGGKVRLGITAPPDVNVVRAELMESGNRGPRMLE